MTKEDSSDEFADLETGLNSEDIRGWNIEDASSFKIREAVRSKRRCETLLNHHPDIYVTLAEVDTILTENSRSLVGHLSGDSFNTITHSDNTDPDSIVIRLVHEIEQLRRIDNHFFQNISNNEPCRVEGTPIIMETGNPYGETVELQTNFSEIELHMPTMQSFYGQRLGELTNGEWSFKPDRDSQR